MAITTTLATIYTPFYIYLGRHIPKPYGIDQWFNIYKEEEVKLLFFHYTDNHTIGTVDENIIVLFGYDSELLPIVTQIAEEYSSKTKKNIEIMANHFIEIK